MTISLLLCLNSVLQSFEEVLSRYTQQLSLNQNQKITTPSLVIVAELVCSLLCTIILHTVYYSSLAHYREVQHPLSTKDDPLP